VLCAAGGLANNRVLQPSSGVILHQNRSGCFWDFFSGFFVGTFQNFQPVIIQAMHGFVSRQDARLPLRACPDGCVVLRIRPRLVVFVDVPNVKIKLPPLH
jgi:hypothetical protein